MIEKQERAAFMKSFSIVAKEYISGKLAPFSEKVDSLERAILELPKPEKGEPGQDGKDGQDGKPIDRAEIITEIVALIPAPKGGKDGIDGKDGLPGKDAVVDLPLIVSEALKQIPAPKDGKDGIDGKDGLPGAAGSPGRDAIQLDILPAVDFDRSYPRNTYARYDGGIIHSFRDTHGLNETIGACLEKSGWEVVVAGLSSIQVTLGDDNRTLTLATRLTGGIESSGSFSLPVMIYRGVYNPESVYQRGDVATWGGSAWHCQENDTKTAPKEDPDYHVWKLMVKEGRGGKPGKDGDPADEKALITKILAELKRTNFDALGFYGRDPK